jgi:hypothetical protein
MAKRKSEMNRSHRHEMPSDFHTHHEHLDHFPTAEELREMDARWGIDRSLDPAEFGLRFERHIRQADWTATTALGLGFMSIDQIKVKFNPWIIKVILALMRRRKNHLTLDNLARDQFNQALQAAHGDGSYQALSVVHSEDHMMHSSMGATGTQRFLPWHREYLFKLENVLRQKQPGVTIPYWDYANDHARPDWVWQPPNVVRNTPGVKGSLPTQSVIDSILLKSSYTQFTYSFEKDAHNQVHNWCNGTITSPSTASQDPIFFLLHANVDRIWDIWQLNHNGVPTLAGSDAILDPWQPVTASDVNDIINMAYSYA